MESTDLGFLLLARDIIYGLAGIAVILLFHGFCLSRILLLSEINTRCSLTSGRYDAVYFHFYASFVALAGTHIAEILIWGAILLMTGLSNQLWEAVLFSGSCYTTLGMMANILPNSWRTLWFMIAFSGLFSLAWSTSAMLGMMNNYREAFLKKHQAYIESAVKKRKLRISDINKSGDPL